MNKPIKQEVCGFCNGAGFVQAMPLVMGSTRTRCIQLCTACKGLGKTVTEHIDYAETVK